MKTYTNASPSVMPKVRRAKAVEMSEEKKQELIKLQARIVELENELKRQNKEQEKQDEILQTNWAYNFNTESLF